MSLDSISVAFFVELSIALMREACSLQLFSSSALYIICTPTLVKCLKFHRQQATSQLRRGAPAAAHRMAGMHLPSRYNLHHD